MKYKLFVFYLDETLWSVSEGLCTLVQPPFTLPHANRVESQEGFWIEVKPGVRELFKYLKDEGCYVSLASRNDAKPTIEILKALKLADYLDFPQLCWRAKEESIQRIIKELQKRDKVSIRPDEVFFVDDWPENVVPVREWGATSLLFGQDVHDFGELKEMLK